MKLTYETFVWQQKILSGDSHSVAAEDEIGMKYTAKNSINLKKPDS